MTRRAGLEHVSAKRYPGLELLDLVQAELGRDPNLGANEIAARLGVRRNDALACVRLVRKIEGVPAGARRAGRPSKSVPLASEGAPMGETS